MQTKKKMENPTVRGLLKSGKLNRMIGRGIQKVEHESDNKRVEILLRKGATAKPKRRYIGKRAIMEITRMLSELHEQRSGTSSQISEVFPFATNPEGRIMLDVQQKLERRGRLNITYEEARLVRLIYKKYFFTQDGSNKTTVSG